MTPIDFDDLATRTFGDVDLADDLLRLFDRQSAMHMAELLGEGAPEARRDVAHTLAGAASAVAAARVADLALRLEAQLAGAHGGEADQLVHELAEAVAEAREAIARRLVG